MIAVPHRSRSATNRRLATIPSATAVVTLLLTGLTTASHRSQQAEPRAALVAEAPVPMAVSSDGRMLVGYGSRGNLALGYLERGEFVELTDVGYPELVMSATFSPDAGRIAYAWHNEQDFDDLRVIRTDGSDQQVLFRDPAVRSVRVNDWTADGSRILVTLVRFDSTVQVASVSASGRSVEVIVSLTVGDPLPQARQCLLMVGSSRTT